MRSTHRQTLYKILYKKQNEVCYSNIYSSIDRVLINLQKSAGKEKLKHRVGIHSDAISVFIIDDQLDNRRITLMDHNPQPCVRYKQS